MASPEEIERVLSYHNKRRARHNAPALSIDPELNAYAQEWAETMATVEVLSHREERIHGENVYACHLGGPEFDPKDAVELWYLERKLFDFARPEDGDIESFGHFSQIVWKSSRKLGVGIARTDNDNVYVVCNYAPAGNVRGQFAANVEAPMSESDDESDSEDEALCSVCDPSNPDVPCPSIGPQFSASAACSDIDDDDDGLEEDYDTDASSVAIETGGAIAAQELRIWSDWLARVGDTALGEWSEFLAQNLRVLANLAERIARIRDCQRFGRAGKGSQSSGYPLSSSFSCPSNCDCPTPCPRSLSIPGVSCCRTSASFAPFYDDDDGDEYCAPDVASDPDNCIPCAGLAPPGAGSPPATPVASAFAPSLAPPHDFAADLQRVFRSEENDSIQDCGCGALAISVPRCEEELRQLIHEFKLKASRYRRLYQHWQAYAAKALEELEGNRVTREPCPRAPGAPPHFHYLLGDRGLGRTLPGHCDRSGREYLEWNCHYLFFNLRRKYRGGRHRREQQRPDT